VGHATFAVGKAPSSAEQRAITLACGPRGDAGARGVHQSGCDPRAAARRHQLPTLARRCHRLQRRALTSAGKGISDSRPRAAP